MTWILIGAKSMAFKLSRILTSRATRVEWSMDHLRSSIYSTIVAIGKKVTSDGMPCVSAHCVHFLRLAITKCTALARDSYRHIKTCRWPFPISPLSNHDSGVDRPTQVIVKALAIILHWCWQSMLRPNDDINRHIALQLHVRWKKCICQNDFKW